MCSLSYNLMGCEKLVSLSGNNSMISYSIWMRKWLIYYNNKTRTSKQMSKKLYIPVVKNGRNYKLYMDDLAKVRPISKKMRPPVPSYHQSDSIVKYEAMTDVEFEPLFPMWIRYSILSNEEKDFLIWFFPFLLSFTFFSF